MAYLSGFHAIEERIRADNGCGPLLVAKPGPRAREIAALAGEYHIRVERTGANELDRLAPGNRGIALEIHDVLVAEAPSFEGFLAEIDNRKDALAVILDEITDPHNYGAILRSCDQFGVDAVITRNKRAAKYSDVVAKASAGASAWVNSIEVPNLLRAVEMLKAAGFWIYGADMTGGTAWQQRLTGRCALVLGSEGGGLSRLLRETCDGLIAIPSCGRIDSLNVSVAAGVLLYEITRQRADASCSLKNKS